MTMDFVASSVWSLVVPVCLVCAIKQLWYWYNIGTRDPSSKLPLPGGGFGWPIVGETFNLVFQGPQFYEKNFAKYGRVFKTHLFTNPTVRVYGADNLAKILQGEGDIVASRWPSSTQGILGKFTLSMSKGQDHTLMRKRLSAAFSHSALTGYAPMIQKAVRQAIESWCGEDQVLAGPVMKHLTFRLAADVLCGFHYTDDAVAILCQKIDDIVNGLMSVPFNLPYSKYRRALHARDYIRMKLEENVRRKTGLKSSQDTQDVTRILIDLSNTSDEQSSQSREQVHEAICDQVVEFLLTGMGSTSSGAVTMVYQLTQNPHVMGKIREELREQGLLTDYTPLTLHAVNQCHYLNQVVKECLRMSPPTGAAFRTAIKTFELDGKQIPKGWTVFWSIRETIHLSDNFRDTHTFDPDRFSADRQEDKLGGRYCMPVFGQGSRSCIGQKYALLTLRILLIELARMCDFELPNPEAVKFSWIPTPMPKCGMPTRFTRVAADPTVDQNENDFCFTAQGHLEASKIPQTHNEKGNIDFISVKTDVSDEVVQRRLTDDVTERSKCTGQREVKSWTGSV